MSLTDTVTLGNTCAWHFNSSSTFSYRFCCDFVSRPLPSMPERLVGVLCQLQTPPVAVWPQPSAYSWEGECACETVSALTHRPFPAVPLRIKLAHCEQQRATDTPIPSRHWHLLLGQRPSKMADTCFCCV